MEPDTKDKIPVIWKSIHEKSKGRWRARFALMNFFYIAIILSLGYLFIQDQKNQDLVAVQKEELLALKTKENVYLILRNRGVSMSQGLDIAEVTIRQSKKLNLSMSLILAVMKKESRLTPDALSSQNGMGLMQVHPVAWEEYVGKLNLKASSHAAFDPVTNTIVATHVLKDLYEYYRKTAKSEEGIRKSVLSAYYAGATSLSRTGMVESHVNYVADVNKFKKEFDEKSQD